MSSFGVCTTRHGRPSGRPVQELNACTVHVVALSLFACGIIKRSLFHITGAVVQSGV